MAANVLLFEYKKDSIVVTICDGFKLETLHEKKKKFQKKIILEDADYSLTMAKNKVHDEEIRLIVKNKNKTKNCRLTRNPYNYETAFWFVMQMILGLVIHQLCFSLDFSPLFNMYAYFLEMLNELYYPTGFKEWDKNIPEIPALLTEGISQHPRDFIYVFVFLFIHFFITPTEGAPNYVYISAYFIIVFFLPIVITYFERVHLMR